MNRLKPEENQSNFKIAVSTSEEIQHVFITFVNG
jgi:hypothetical protein